MTVRRSVVVLGIGVCAIPTLGEVNFNLSVRNSADGARSVTVAPGDSVHYSVVGSLTADAEHMGLAFYAFDLMMEGAIALPKADAFPDTPAPSGPPTTTTCMNVMRNFQGPQGTTNPAGIGGTVIDGKLVQIGGAQNTTKNTVNLTGFPTGTVITGIARGGKASEAAKNCGPATLVTGAFPIPKETPIGSYKLSASNVFADVIETGQTGAEEVWATKSAVVGLLEDLVVTVAAPQKRKLLVSALPAATAEIRNVPERVRVLSRTKLNEVRLDFEKPLTTDSPDGSILIREMRPDGLFESAIDPSNFTFVRNGLRLTIKDNASNLIHRRWYQIQSAEAPAWKEVDPFCLQFLVQAGDCDGSGGVATADLTCVNAKVGTFGADAASDSNFIKDINGERGIGTADVSDANKQVPSPPVLRPSGHETCP